MARFLLIFVDGVGLAPPAPDNPLATSAMPAVVSLLGGALTSDLLTDESRQGFQRDVTLAALDANLGVAGLPQSATGQTTLFTGVNAAALIGRHVPSFPGGKLRELIEESGVLAAVDGLGLRSTFANAFSPAYFRLLEQRKRRKSVTLCLVEAAGQNPRGLEDLRAGRAVSWDLTREMFAAHAEAEPPLEVIATSTAGRHLVELTRSHDLVVYESFLTDLAGHGRFEGGATVALELIDGLIAGVVDSAAEDLEQDLTILITSDHGNVEELGHRRHTRNPVPLLAKGSHAEQFASLTSLDEVTPTMLALFGEQSLP